MLNISKSSLSRIFKKIIYSSRIKDDINKIDIRQQKLIEKLLDQVISNEVY